MRARVGRADEKRCGSTVAFIRSQRRDGFYRIRSSRREEAPSETAGHSPLPVGPGEGQGEGGSSDSALPIPHSALEEISLLEAANEFRATNPKEPAIPLHSAHHDQINAALEKFKQSVVAETLQAEIVDGAQGPNEQRALRYLDGFTGLPFVSDEERALIQSAKLAIRRARFQSLQRQINALQRSTKTVKLTPTALTDKLILRTYPLQQADA